MQRSAAHRILGVALAGGVVFFLRARPVPEGKGVNVRLYYLVLCVCTDWVTEWLTRPCLSRELRGGELPAAYLSTYLPTSSSLHLSICSTQLLEVPPSVPVFFPFGGGEWRWPVAVFTAGGKKKKHKMIPR